MISKLEATHPTTHSPISSNIWVRPPILMITTEYISLETYDFPLMSNNFSEEVKLVIILFTGFTVTKELSSGVFNTVVNGDPKSPSIWSDKASTEDYSPIASSFNVDGKIEKLNGMHKHMNGSAYDNSEEGSMKSPTSSPERSPFNSTQLRVNEVSPHNNETHRYLYFSLSSFSS